MRANNAAYRTQQKAREIVAQGFAFADALLNSYATSTGLPKNRQVLDTAGKAWVGEDRTIAHVVVGSRSSAVELPRDSHKIAALLGHFTSSSSIRPGQEKLPLCLECVDADKRHTRLLATCNQIALPNKSKKHQACTECVLRGKTCSLATKGMA